MQVHIQWMKKTGRQIYWQFKEWWSGSARTSAKARGLHIGFPVDCRYGWDLSCPAHWTMLEQAATLFGTDVELYAPECTLWSQSCTTLPVQEKADGRAKQLPMLTKLKNRFIARHAAGKHCMLEQPYGSAMLHESPIASLLEQFSRLKTSQCAYGCKNEEGQPVRKDTDFIATFSLKNAVRPCRWTGKHAQLQGQVPGTSVSRTSVAMVCSHVCNCYH